MRGNTFGKSAAGLSLSVLSVLPREGRSADLPTRPNIILLIGDDMSPDFGCYGGGARTPNIDRLAAGGIRFENAYVTASSCSPSRNSIITGRYPHNTGAPELHMPLPEGQLLFPEALKDAGYYCVQAGKWHMGDYAKQVFHDVFDVPYSADPSGAMQWIRILRERPKDKPFFMWLAAWDAHRPWEPDPDALPHDPNKGALPAGVPDTPEGRRDMAAYYDEIQRFDRHVGSVVDELKEQGVFENTLLIILADNGRPFPRNKTTLYDNGMKTPLVVHWPAGRIAAGTVSGSLISTIDIAPAVLEVAGLPVPPEAQGVSFLPVLTNPEHQTRSFIFGERNWHVQRACARMVRHENHVYIRNFTQESYSFQMVDHASGSYAELLRLKAEGILSPEQAEEFSTGQPEEQLFDVAADPQQLRNLVGNPEKRAVLEHLREALDYWQRTTGDSIPAIDDLTADRQCRETFKRLYPGGQPPRGILPGQEAGAEQINHCGIRKE